MPRRLILLRHAQAESAPLGDFSIEADLARPLTPVGEAAALRCGVWLRKQDLAPDAILCSTARRTRQTLHNVMQAFPGSAATPDFSVDLYEAEAQTLLERLRRTPPAVRTLLLVGHNPGISLLASRLDSTAPELDEGFAPGSIAVFSVWDNSAPHHASGWQNSLPDGAILHTFTRP
ncbi:MAG: histidine phosphatase family protein [Acetobacter sp.]|uniref:SixA phosphatase family protein n=1 Tax=Acetobacter sp. TaxID=440 RepID=UPI0039E8F542